MNIFDLQATISLNGDAFMSGVQSAQTAFNGLGSSVGAGTIALGTAVGNMATKAASGLVDLGKESIQTGMDFDAAMSNVKAISGATGEEFDALRDKAKEMGASTKFTATEAAEAFSYMAMAGWDAESMLSGIEGIMNLAAASGESLATTSDIVTDALTAFGLSAEDSGHFADVLAAASSAANTNVSMMGETFKYVAPVAGTLGYSVEDMATAIGTMANSGIKGSQAGTTLRAALKNLLDPSDAVKESMMELGLIMHSDLPEDFAYDLDDLSDELYKVDQATKKVDAAQLKYNDALVEFGPESDKTKNALTKLEKAQFDLEKAEKKLHDAQNAQIAAATEYNSALTEADGTTLNFAQTVDILREAFSGLSETQQAEYASTIFGSEAMSGMLAIINSAESDYNSLAETIESASDAMDGIGAAAEMAQTQMDNLAGDVTIFKSAFDGLKTAIYDNLKEPLRDAVQTSTGIISDLTTAINEEGLAGAFSRLGEIIGDNLGPKIDELMGAFERATGINISGIAESVGLFTDAFAKSGVSDSVAGVAKAAGDLFEKFQTVSSETIGKISDTVGEFFDRLSNSEVPDKIADMASDVNEFLAAFLTVSGDAIEKIGEGVDVFLGAFERSGIEKTIGLLVGHVADFLGAFARASDKTIRAIGDAVGDFFDGFNSSPAPDALATIVDDVLKFIDTVTKVSAETVEKLGGAVERFLGAFDSFGVGEAFGGFVEACGELFDAIADTSSEAIEDVGKAIGILAEKSDIEGDAEGLSKLTESLLSLADSSISSVAEWIRGIADAFSGLGTNTAEAWAEFGPNVGLISDKLADFVEKCEDAASRLNEALAPIRTLFEHAFGKTVQWALQSSAGALGGIEKALSGMIGLVTDNFSLVIDVLSLDFPAALEDAKQGWEDFKLFLEGLKDSLLNPIKAIKDDMVQAGKDLIQGLIDGIKAKWEEIQNTIADVGISIVNKIMSIWDENSPSKVFYQIGEYAVEGLALGWSSEFSKFEESVAKDVSGIVSTTKMGFENSAIGKSSAAGISAMNIFGADNRVSSTINLNVDGEKVASVVYDPLNDMAVQMDRYLPTLDPRRIAAHA